MGLEFLARVRRTALWVGAVAALLTATYATPMLALAVALGAAWSLVNLGLLERLIVAITGADHGTRPAFRRAVQTSVAMLGLFVAGGLMLRVLSPLALVVGFAIPHAVIVLKALALLVLPSNLWRRVTSDARIATLVVALLVGGAWLAAAPLRSLTSTRAHVTAPAVEESGAATTAHEAEKSSGPEKFPNFITILHRAFPNAGWSRFLHQYEVIVFSLLIAFLLGLVARLATRHPQMVPSGLQNLVEMVVEKATEFINGILGAKHTPRFVPFLGTLFVYIWAMNLFGLIPFMDSPTSNLNVTVALALGVFVYVQYVGLRSLGVVGYLDHLAGNPRTPVGWLLVPLMLPIHIMGELAKPISLSCRLFGNIFGEDMLLVAFATLGVMVLSFTHLPIGLPLQLPFLLLALLTSTLQALVFTVLSTIYFLLMLPHDDHAAEGEAAHAH